MVRSRSGVPKRSNDRSNTISARLAATAAGRFLSEKRRFRSLGDINDSIRTCVDLASGGEDAADTRCGQDMDAFAEQSVRDEQMHRSSATRIECVCKGYKRPAAVADIVDDEYGLSFSVALDGGVGQHTRLLVAYLATTDNPAVCLIDCRVLAHCTCIGVRDGGRACRYDGGADLRVRVDCPTVGQRIEDD